MSVIPYVADHDFTLYAGDVRDVLATLPDGSVDCVVTSPPYWGLRDYGTGQWAGGDPECAHEGSERYYTEKTAAVSSAGAFSEPGEANKARLKAGRWREHGTCVKCGAARTDQQLGLESTPDEYLANMVAVFREVRRVLAPHGTCWVNLGDSYAASLTSDRHFTQPTGPDGTPATKHPPQFGGQRTAVGGLKPKDLCGIPWRVAFALQADGWYLRSDIVWSKPNPMPESVTDRPTKSHEYVFLLSKGPRYFFDQEAVREPHRWQDLEKLATNAQARQGARLAERRAAGDVTATRTQDSWNAAMQGERPKGRGNDQDRESEFAASPNGRNVRSVWEIATQPYAEAHFATYPEALVERCLKAGCPEWVCGTCGAPWVRVLERGESDYARLKREQGHGWTDMDAAALERGVILKEGEGGQTRNANGTVPSLKPAIRTDHGFAPSCICADVPEVRDDNVDNQCVRGSLPLLRSHLRRPGVVLDPFMGSGTTALVARRLGRHAIGVELNPEYAALCARRLQQLALPFEATL